MKTEKPLWVYRLWGWSILAGVILFGFILFFSNRSPEANHAQALTKWGTESTFELAGELERARATESDLRMRLYNAEQERKRLEEDYAARFTDAAVKYQPIDGGIIRVVYNETEIEEIQMKVNP